MHLHSALLISHKMQHCKHPYRALNLIRKCPYSQHIEIGFQCQYCCIGNMIYLRLKNTLKTEYCLLRLKPHLKGFDIYIYYYIHIYLV